MRAILILLLLIDLARADGLPAGTQPAATLPSAAQPATAPAFDEGLVAEIYALPRRPKRFRNVLPGLPPKVVRIVPTPDIRSGEDLQGVTGNVQAEFVGEIDIPESGEFGFAADADDGADVHINGQFIISDIWINGTRTPSRAVVRLERGWQPMRVRFFQGDGGFRLRLRWKPPGAEDFAAIPADRFRVPRQRVGEAKAKLAPAAGADNDPATAHRAVFRTQGFFELPESEGDLLVDLLEGPTLYSKAARKDFASTIEQTNYLKLPYWHQVKVVSGFLRGWYNGGTERGPVTVRAAYVISEPEPVEYDGWAGKKRQGFRHRVSIEDESYTIYTPAADSVERENIAQGIAGLPKSLRVLLRTVTVEPYGTASEFNGGGDTIWIRRQGPTPLEMIDSTFSHEIGHLLMNRTDCYLAWEQAIAKDLLSLSHYGRLNPSEDFAEFVRTYLSTEGNPGQLASLRTLFPSRMRVMDDVLKQVNFEWIATNDDRPANGSR